MSTPAGAGEKLVSVEILLSGYTHTFSILGELSPKPDGTNVRCNDEHRANNKRDLNHLHSYYGKVVPSNP